MIPDGFDRETGFPPGYVAEVDGEPVRRVACNGDPSRGIERWLDMRGIEWHGTFWAYVHLLGELQRDQVLYGDAYVASAETATGWPVVRRADPRRVLLRRADLPRTLPRDGGSDA